MSFFEEGFQSSPEPVPQRTDRAYGEVVPFERAFHPRAVAVLGLTIARQQPLWMAGIGMGVLVAAVILPLELRIPLPDTLERGFRSSGLGLGVGYLVHRALSLSPSALLSTVVGGASLGAVSRLVRGDAHAARAFYDREMLMAVLTYELLSQGAGLVLALPFVLAALLFPGGAALVLVLIAAGVTALVSVATRPGLWALCVDGLHPRDAFIGGLVGATRHPLTLALLYAAYGAALIASVGAFAFLVIGVFQLGIAASWVAFGATEEELASHPLLDEMVP